MLNKDKEIQRAEIYKVFYSGIYTMKEVAVNLSIDRGNVCWAVGEFRDSNRIKLVKKGMCSITKDKNVGFYTADPDLFPEDNQTRFQFE